MWMVVQILAGDITNLHNNFVVAKPLVMGILVDDYIYEHRPPTPLPGTHEF